MRIAILYESWLTHEKVGADEIAVLAVLALHAGKDGACWPSQRLLAHLLGRSRPWVNKVIRTLVALDLLEKADRSRNDGGRRTSWYRLAVPARQTCSTDDTIRPAEDTIRPAEDIACRDADNGTVKQELITDALPASAPRAVSPVVSLAMTPTADWQPGDDDLLFAVERFPHADLTAATEKFVSKCRARGYRYHDLGAAWRVWLAEDQDAQARAENPKAAAAKGRFAVWASVAQRARTGGGDAS
jgi:DNA-binding MarR family transcriptional regulator